MNLDDILGESVRLEEFVRDPKKLPEWAWLYTKSHGEVSLSTVCRTTLISSRELSEEEAEARDDVLQKEGFRCLLSRDQIEDIIANLRFRHPHPTLRQIEEALMFYLTHDAFIVT